MWAGFNCMLAAGMIREAAAMTTQISGEIIPSNVPGSLAMGYRQPVGVVAGIAPWNAPVILGVRAIAMPLACGNTVVLKASEMCPGTHRLIGTIFREAGFPPGVVNVVTNAPKDAGAVVDALIAHKAVRRVNFTGSSRVGKIIAKKCAEYLKPVLLELGGKSPLVVLDDADLDAVTGMATHLGLAFQIVDDLLDVTSTTEQLGKTTHKDDSRGKNTYPHLLGIEGSRNAANKELEAALSAAATLPDSQRLFALIRFVADRQK
jgi:delta 1-pyrroline-5-carboxylate dehydrogenase